MTTPRLIDNYCGSCQDVTLHVIRSDDPGCCACTVCGLVAQLMVPI